MANSDVKIQIKIDKRAENFFQREAPRKLQESRKNAVEAMGKVWADAAKEITRDEDHIVTGRYVNSIGYLTGAPASEADVIHDLAENRSETVLKTGSNVAYAGSLEKKYNIMARGLDVSEDRMQKVAQTQVKKTLFG